MKDILYQPPYLDPDMWIKIADQRLGKFLKVYARDIVQDPAIAEDVVQKTYLKAYNRLRRLTEMSAKEKADNWPRTDQWLIRAVRNSSLRYLDYARKYQAVDDEYFDDIPAPGQTTLSEMILQEEQELLRRKRELFKDFIDQLSPAHAEVMHLYLEQIALIGKPNIKYIAETLGLSRNAAKVKVHRAKKQLNKLFEQSLFNLY